MQSFYEKLVRERGREFANQYMRELRAKRKLNVGGGFNDPAVRAKALEKRSQDGNRKDGDPVTDPNVH